MIKMSVREIRAELTRLEELVETEGEVVITRRGKPIAKVVAMEAKGRAPSHRDLRAAMRRVGRPSESLIREDRDAR